MDICIKVIEPGTHRQGITGADWYFDRFGNLQVRVTRMSTWEREVSLALHEAIEAVLAKKHGVTVKQVDEFDEAFTSAHPENGGIEAGDQPGCPYGREHMAATACERVVAMELDIGPWTDYDREVGSLG